MQVAIDGVLMPPPFDLDQLPSVNDIAGIEIYNGPSTLPAQFRGLPQTSCGLILVWTKD